MEESDNCEDLKTQEDFTANPDTTEVTIEGEAESYQPPPLIPRTTVAYRILKRRYIDIPEEEATE